MKCPNCNSTLKLAERQGIEIDYCGECRGVWLDRGELDKIIERAAAEMTGRRRDDSDGFSRDWSGDRPAPKRKKATSLLGELFDF
ncbi:MAG: zf-TFIIB domain-containing protein [Ilumatobacteraceae bacterium]